MLHVRRVRFESVGHPDARFSPLQLDFTGDGGVPQHSVLWLRNGGGKSSILNLLFALARPGRREFLGSTDAGKDRRIGDYVAAADTAHVVIEWGQPADSLPAWVTGMVLEWQDRTRSVDESRLKRLWYAFIPADTRPPSLLPAAPSLRFDTLPFVVDGRRLRLAAFRDRLREAAAVDPALELVIPQSQAEWRRHLESIDLDPEVFRYQLQMNREEGGASQLFKRRSRTDGDFVDLLLELVVAPEQPGRVADVYARYADELAQRPQVEHQRTFLSGVLERLRPLADAVADHTRASGALVVAAGEASRLRAGLDAAAARAGSDAERLANQAERLGQQASEEDSRRARLNELATAARRLAAQLRVDAARAAHAATEGRRLEAERAVTAWRLVEPLARRRHAEAQLAAISAELSRVERQTAPLRAERDQAARRLAARLVVDERHLDDAASEATARAGTADAAAEAAANRRRELAGALARVEAEQAAIRARRHGYEQARSRAQAAALITAVEEPEAALHRTATEQDDVARQLAATDTALAEADAKRQQLRDRRDALMAELAKLGAERAQAEGELTRMRGRVGALAGDARLVEVSETDQPDLWGTGGLLADQLDGIAADADRRLVATELAAADDRHALSSLEVDNLLPPRRETAAVLTALEAAGVAAVAGWRFLADSVPAGQRETVVAARPELVDGVVVLDPVDLGHAREVLAGRGLRPAAAVAVGPSSPLADPPPGGSDPPAPYSDRFVLPPAESLFDRAAGERERERRAVSLEGVDARSAELRRARDRDATLAGRIRDLLAAYPPETREALACREAELGEAVARAQGASRAAREEDALLGRELADLEAHRRMLSERVRALAGALPRLESLVAQAVADRADAARGRDLAGERDCLTADAAAAGEEESARRLEARDVREEAAGHRAAAERCRGKRAELALPDPGDLGLPDQPAEALEVRFRLLDDRYRALVTDAALDERRRQAEAELATLDVELSAAASDLRTAAQRLLTGSDGGDPPRRRAALAVAEEEHRRAIGAAAAAAERLRVAEATLAAMPPARVELPDSFEAATPQQADALAEDYADLATAASGRATALRNEALAAEKGSAAASANAQALRGLAAVLNSSLSALPTTLPLPEAGTVEPFEGDGEAASSQVEASAAALRQAAEAESAAREQVSHTTEALTRFVLDRRHDDLEGPLRERLGRDPTATIAAQAERYVGDVEIRLTQCEQKLTELDTHRELLVAEIASSVDTALHLLRGAERASTLPEGFGDWSGQRFLHIRYDHPSRDEELRGRLSSMVDGMVSDGVRPEGLALLQRAAHAAVGPRGFAVTILKPNPALRPDRVPVADLSTFSGGEQLTASILLYCTLAQRRARSRGRTGSGGVLVLDNPIGKSSNVTLLELQRRVADAMGVQLVYTTAVDDRDAVAALPNWVRLRNDRMDRRTGNQHVEVDDRDGDAASTRVTAARVWRRDAALVSPAGGS